MVGEQLHARLETSVATNNKAIQKTVLDSDERLRLEWGGNPQPAVIVRVYCTK